MHTDDTVPLKWQNGAWLISTLYRQMVQNIQRSWIKIAKYDFHVLNAVALLVFASETVEALTSLLYFQRCEHRSIEIVFVFDASCRYFRVL